MPLVPSPLLFRFTLPVPRVDRLPRTQSPVLALSESCRIPFPSTLDGTPSRAELRMAWNPLGLAVSITVSGKSSWPRCSPESVLSSDGVQVLIDTRDTQSVHRATRFCHQFFLLPLGGEPDPAEQVPRSKGRGKSSDVVGAPCLKQLPIPRAREDAAEIDPQQVLMESEVRETGYTVAAWFPAEVLHGFDPDTHARLGFSLCVHDTELGRQYFTVGEEFPVDADPSLWVSLELTGRDDSRNA